MVEVMDRDRPWRKRATRLWVAVPLAFCAVLFLAHLQFYGRSDPLLTSGRTPLQGEAKSTNTRRPPLDCDFSKGRWERGRRTVHYDGSCPFHRNAWNCLRNGRQGMDDINSWVWIPRGCDDVDASAIKVGVDPAAFLNAMRDRRIGFVGDSLNENFLVSFLCILRSADTGATKWKRKGAWRGGYFPRFNVTVAYHRAVLLARYRWQPAEGLVRHGRDQVKGIYRVDVDIPADDWINITDFYDVLVFNTGHWWGSDKFPKETPLIFYREDKPIYPPLGILEGLKVVLENIVSYIEREVPRDTIKLWRTQSPRHFYGGDWNQNGSCLFKKPIEKSQLDTWFDPRNGGVNKEAREVNNLILNSLLGTNIQILNITHLSEFRADAHPAIWLGKRDAVAVWGQDCLHWCLPGVPDTWVDILATIVLYYSGKDVQRAAVSNIDMF